MKTKTWIPLMGALALLSGCGVIGPRTAMTTESADESVAVMEQGIAENERISERGREVSEALMEALMPSESDGGAAYDQRFDLSVNDVPAREFFRGLVQDTPYNMVVHPEVAGDVSLDLKDVSVPEVMEIMRDVYGYDFTRFDATFNVYPDALRTEIYQVNYLNVERRGSSEMRVSSGRVSDAGGGRGGGSGGYGDYGRGDAAYDSGRGGIGAGGARVGGNVVGTSINTDAETDFWEELEETLSAIAAGDAGARVVVTPQVGLVVVRARPDSLYAVRSYLSRVENTLHRQVILEAKVVEVTLREGFQAGINWQTFGDAVNGEVQLEDSTDGQFLFGSGADVFNPLGSTFTLSAVYDDFQAVIELLKTQGSVQVLSSPRIATVNNQKAVIKVGSDEFFVTDVSTSVITAGNAINTLDSPELTPFFSGIALDVTPQISDDGDVILHIHPSVSEVDEQLKNIGGELVPLAASQIRESDSIVRASNGQIVVIGGLMQNTAEDNNARVPGLGRIPGLGYLFKQTSQTSVKSELVILLKPIVVNGGEQADFMRRSNEHIRELRRELNRRG